MQVQTLVTFFTLNKVVYKINSLILRERISNRIVNVNIEGINNEDTWLYQLDAQNIIQSEWKKVENIYAGATEELTPEQRRYFQITISNQ